MPKVVQLGESSYKKYATDDFQNRGDRGPKSGVPDDIQVAEWKGNVEFIFSFKSTSERAAQKWVERWMKQKGIPVLSIDAGQGDDSNYQDDWVEVLAKVQ